MKIKISAEKAIQLAENAVNTPKRLVSITLYEEDKMYWQVMFIQLNDDGSVKQVDPSEIYVIVYVDNGEIAFPWSI